MNRSRLTRRLEKQTLKSLVFSVLGIIIILFLLVKFGIPLLVNISLFVSGDKTQQSTPQSKNSFISPPILKSEYTATNSANIKISGSSSSNQTIDLYINDNLVDKTETDESGNFSFDAILVEEQNSIKAKATTSDGKESNFSEKMIISFKNKSPTLEVNSPQDGQTFSKDQNVAEVKGKSDTNVRVTINNFWAITDENNNFSYNLSLKEGENEVKIVAQDEAGNKTEKTIKVTYYP